MCGGKKGCQKLSELKGSPQGCTPEQIRKCHGNASEHVCITAGCERPARLRGKPKECSPEQIKKCHGDAARHPCVESR